MPIMIRRLSCQTCLTAAPWVTCSKTIARQLPETASPVSPSQAGDVKFQAYRNNLQDRPWMWGHDLGEYEGPNGVYNIPLSAPIAAGEE